MKQMHSRVFSKLARLKGVFAVMSAVGALLLSQLPISASATALPLLANNHMYFVNYSTGTLNEITGLDGSGNLTTTVICATTCSSNPVSASGAYFDSVNGNVVYVANGSSRSGIFKAPINGGAAGIAQTVSSSIGYDAFSLAGESGGTTYTLTNGAALHSFDMTTGVLGNAIGSNLGVATGDVWNGFAMNPVDGRLYGMTRSSGALYSINVSTGVATQVGSTAAVGIPGSYSMQIDSAGTFWVLDTNSKLFSFSVTGSTISTPVQRGAFATFATTALVLNSPPPSHTVTFDANGGTGTQTAQTGTSTANLPSTTTFVPPTGKRFWGWWDAATGGSYMSSFGFTTDTTAYARWTGGPLTYSASAGGTSAATLALPTTVVAATNTFTIYVKNSSATSATSLGNINGPNTNGLTKTGGTCVTNASLAASAECTVILTWTPSAAGDLPGGTTLSIQSTGAYTESVTLTGTAVINKTVTFHKNDVTGSATATQLGYSTQALTANTWSRSGYTFAGWDTQALGGGTAFADAATYSFASNLDLYAQWTLIPAVVTPVTPTAPPTPSGPTVTGTLGRVFTEESPQVMTIEGHLFDDLESVTVNGVAVKVLASSPDSIQFDLGSLAPGTYSVYLKFKAGSLVYQDAITVKAKPATPGANGNSGSTTHAVIEKLLAGFMGDSKVLTASLKANIASTLKKLPTATSLVCTGSTSNSRVTAADLQLAKARAVAACAYAKKISSALQIKIAVNPSSGLTASARNVLLKLSN